MYDVRTSHCFGLRYRTAGFVEEFGSNPHEQIRVDVVDTFELAVERGTRDPAWRITITTLTASDPRSVMREATAATMSSLDSVLVLR
jgi:hypothetical protein